MNRFDSNPMNRRTVLGALGAAGATLTGVPALACVLSPTIEEGPFFVDEHLNRSDLTAGTARAGVVGGTPLRLALRVETMRGSSCEPLAGAHVVDVWHADATGLYSDEAPLHTRGERFLRGYQVTGGDGAVRFTTIFPGWYPERTPHVHIKIRTFSHGNAANAFTSQLYFDEAVTDAVLARRSYATRGRRDTTNARDQLFDARMVVPVVSAGDGYAGTFTLRLRATV
jgi:protocatechuate 3,4-dioxygenase beta subunit